MEAQEILGAIWVPAAYSGGSLDYKETGRVLSVST